MSARLGNVLITAATVASSAASLQYLRDAGCDVLVQSTPLPVDERWLIEQVRDVHALVFAMEPVSSRLIDAASELRVIARPGVGYDTVDLAAASRRGIAVTIASGTNDQSVADFAMGLLLVCARRILEAAASCQQRKWQRAVGTEIWGKTLTIIGLGRIGKGMAKRARGFDMRVLAVSRSPDPEFAAQYGIQFVSLEDGLRQADFVSLHAPLTAATANMIDTRALSTMKRGSYLINTSRGGLIDEPALVQAVRDGRLAGAAVDVLREQGEGSGSPLIGVPGIVVTPHMATFAREAMERVAFSVAQSVVAVLRGERPASLVNPEIYSQ